MYMLENSSSSVVSMLLVGSDGSRNHRVARWGMWLFDSNCAHAVPLTRANLNWCVNGNDDGTTCVSIEEAYELIFQDKGDSRRKRQRKRRKDTHKMRKIV